MSHYYFSSRNQADRLFNEWRAHKKIVIAYDFDNTVYDYHQEGHDYSDVITLLQQCRDFGAYFIVFTAATEERYPQIQQYLEAHGIPWDVINDNVPAVPFTVTTPGQKIYYNILLDDRAGLREAFEILKTTLKRMQHQLILDTNYFQKTPRYLDMESKSADKLESYMAEYYDLSKQQYPPRQDSDRPYPIMPDHITFAKDNTALTVHGYPIHSYVSMRPDVFLVFYSFFVQYNMLHLLPAHMHKNLFRVSSKQNTLRYRQSRKDTITLDLPDTLNFFYFSRDLKDAMYLPHENQAARVRGMRALCHFVRDTLLFTKAEHFNISEANKTSLNISLNMIRPALTGTPIAIPRHTL